MKKSSIVPQINSVSMVASLAILLSCGGSPLSPETVYEFAGIKRLSFNKENRTYALAWDTPSGSSANLVYTVYRFREGLDPATASVNLALKTEVKRDSFLTTKTYDFNGKDCFIVRLTGGSLKEDENRKFLCADKHEALSFTGLTALTFDGAGNYTAEWDSLPEDYWFNMSAANAVNKLTSLKWIDLGITVKDEIEGGNTSLDLSAHFAQQPLNFGERRCFGIRMYSTNIVLETEDSNESVLCTEENYFATFGLKNIGSGGLDIVSLTWDAITTNTNVKEYVIYRAEGNDTPTELKTVTHPSASTTDTIVRPGSGIKTYRYRVRARSTWNSENNQVGLDTDMCVKVTDSGAVSKITCTDL